MEGTHADLEGHRKGLREALGNTLSDEFVDVILGKLQRVPIIVVHSPNV